MKTIISALALLALPFLSFSQSRSVAALQKKYEEKSNCFMLSLNGDMLGMFSGFEDMEKKPELKELSKKIQSLKILSVTKETEGYSPSDLTDLRAEIKRESFEELMSAKSKDGNIKVLVKESKGKVNQFLMLIDNPNGGFTVLDFKGCIELNKVSKITQEVHM